MEHQKIINLLENTTNQLPKFRAKIWTQLNDQSRGNYSKNSEIRFKITMLKSKSNTKENYQMIAKDLSKQQALNTEPRAIEPINFAAHLDIAGNTTMFFIIEEAENTVLDFSQAPVKVFEMCYRIKFPCMI